MSKDKSKKQNTKHIIVDGNPKKAPFDLPAKKKEEIKDRIEKLYGDALKKKSENN